jgi:ABC-type branched-subunit amino acid transport system substrate-binding protein
MPFVRLAALLGGVLLLAACAQTTVPAPESPAQGTEAADAPAEVPHDGPYSDSDFLPSQVGPVETGPPVHRVGLLVPLSGAPEQVGQDLLAAAQMALFDLSGEHFELLPRDSGASEAFAVDAATRLIQEDRVDLILGPLLSDSARVVAPLVRDAGVPMITFSNDRSVASADVFVLGFAPQDQVRRVMGYARGRGFGQFAALVPVSSYGSLMAASVTEAAAELGVTAVETAWYPTDPSDTAGRTEVVKQLADYDERHKALNEQRAELEARDDEISKRALKRLEILDTLGDVGFDALVLPAGGNEVRELAPLLAFYDVDPGRVKLLGTWLWDDPSLGREPTMVGAWFAAPPPESRTAFVDRFAKLYGRQPSRLATLGYDAVALAAVLARRTENVTVVAGATPTETSTPSPTPYSIEALTSVNGFAGMDGIFRLLPDGRTERGLAVLEIRRDGIAVVDPAPQSFAPVVN